ncbi:MAG: AhpC/TSA family protein [Chitinophagaceae bacterium]|nr:AhpC/TSA family protein [Chitinophagaceae bacterium]
MKQLLLSLAAAIIAIAATSQGYTIKGKLTGFSDSAKIWITDVENQSILDTPMLKKGVFTSKGVIDDMPGYFHLAIKDNGKFYNRVFYIGNEVLQITGDSKSTMDYWSFRGSIHQDVQNRYVMLTRDIYKQREADMDIYVKISSDTTAEAKRTIKEIIVRQKHFDSLIRNISIRFIKENYNSYAGANLLWGYRKYISKEEMMGIAEKIKSPYSESRYSQKINTFFIVGDELKKGDTAVDFEARDTSGVAHRLFAIKGKYILLDFAEFICPPCVASIPELKEVYSKYGNKLQIITFDVDKKREAWLLAVKRDKTPWLNLWDGKGVSGETVLKYGVYSYPTFVLIDPQGKIIAKTSGYSKGTLTKLLEQNIK